MNVGDIMTQEVISIGPEATVADAAKLMLREHVSGLPVIGASHTLLGIVTEGDLLRRIETGTAKNRPRWLEFFASAHTLASEYVHGHSRRVTEVMTPDVIVVSEDMALERVVDLMERYKIKRLPVMREGRVVGILARANLLRALSVSLPVSPIKAGDRTIRRQLEKELADRAWKPRLTQIMVRDGVIDIWGYVTDERHRNAVRVAAENIPGVVKVRDHIMWFEPFSGVVVASSEDTSVNLLH